ncbi:MAG: TGS domain-containing protein, partial [Tepidisphaeraceae bacterium]
PPITPEHLPGGLLGTIRGANIVAIVVDASADPLEETEVTLDLLNNRGLTLKTIAHGEMDPSDFNALSAIIVANKADVADDSTLATLKELYAGRLEVWPVSAVTGQGLDGWVRRLWGLLSLVRVYTRQPGKPADKGKPFTLPLGSTIDDLAREIHRELPEKMKFARIWGNGRFAGQQVHRTEVLHDGDQVEIHE